MRHDIVDYWGLVHLQEDFACRRMPAVDGLSAFKQCAKIADFRRVPSHATFCLCRGATAASDQMLGSGIATAAGDATKPQSTVMTKFVSCVNNAKRLWCK